MTLPKLASGVLEPYAVRIPEAKRLLGKCKTGIYQALWRGDLEAIKDGDSTLITVESIKRYQENLPRAEFTQRETPTKRPQRRSRGKRS